MIIRKKFNLWRDANKGLKSRVSRRLNQPALERTDVPTRLVQNKIERGDRVQKIRLERYPTIDVDFEKVYAGTVETSLEEVGDILFEMGFRNGPLAYVEVTDKFGPDDGSYWLHIITETGRFPIIENRLGLFRRIKDQIHVVVWDDGDQVHFGAHREQSAILQPARHVAINEADAERGVRDFRNVWEDTFGTELGRPLDA